MATPKKKYSKSKTRIHKKIWKNKARKKILNALNWSKLMLKKSKSNKP